MCRADRPVPSRALAPQSPTEKERGLEREGDAQTDRHTGKKKTKVSQSPSVLRRVCCIYWHSRVRLYTQI